jgi:hypothetical protein
MIRGRRGPLAPLVAGASACQRAQGIRFPRGKVLPPWTAHGGSFWDDPWSGNDPGGTTPPGSWVLLAGYKLVIAQLIVAQLIVTAALVLGTGILKQLVP